MMEHRKQQFVELFPSDRFARIRGWLLQGSLGILDQILFSGSNFLASIMLARWLSIKEFGIFAISYSVLIFIAQLHASFLVEPMGVVGLSSFSKDLEIYIKRQISIHFVLMASAGALLLVSTLIFSSQFNRMTNPFRAIAILLPFILLPWLMRRAFYIISRPMISVLGSLFYAVVLLAFIPLFREYKMLSSVTAIFIISGAGAVSGLFMYLFLRSSDIKFAPSPREVFNRNWEFSRWLLPASLFVGIASQAQVFIVGGLLGVDQAGAFRATQVFSQPVTLSITALVAIMTPSLSMEFVRGNQRVFNMKIALFTFCLTLIAFGFCVFLFLFSRPLEHLVYGGKFSQYNSIIPLWGLIPIISGLYSGLMAALQVAQRPYALLIASLVWAPVSLGLGTVFTLWWGLAGAVWSAVAGYLVLCLVYCVLYWIWIVGPHVQPRETA